MSEVVFSEESSGKVYVMVWGDISYRTVATGWLQPFPGSEQMWVSYGLWVEPEHRGQGYSKLYNKAIKEFVANKEGRAIVATVATSNELQHSRLKKLGWEQLSKTLWMTRV